MYLPIVSIKKYLPLMIVGLCAVALSACGSGGGPEDRSPVPLQLLVGHGLTAGSITVAPGAADEHGNVVISCPAGGEACVVNVAADGSASYQRSGGMPSFMPARASQTLPAGHGLAAGEITVDAGAADEHGNVVVSCPAGGQVCVLTVAADGSASYQKTGGMPALMAAPVSWRVPAGDGRMAESLNALPVFVRNNVASRLALTATRSVVSSTASTTNVAPITGGSTWNTGVTQATANADPNSPDDNRAINAGYLRGNLVFERINFGLELRHDTSVEPRPPGYRTTIPPMSDAPQWKGVEHFFVSRSGGRYRSVFHSDIENNDDGDYLALGYWAWTTGPGGNRAPFVGAAASGNDPFQVGHIAAVAGRATYEGAATGLYADGAAPSSFRGFGAGVKLTADFDENSIVGLVTEGEDSTGKKLFDELVLETAAIQDADAAFFRGMVSGVVNGQTAEGNWGGQFYGNGLASADIPVSFAETPGSVAGTFGARATGGDSLLGVFGAYRE